MTGDEMNTESASTPLAPRPRRTWWRAFMLTGIIFVSGIMVGVTTAAYAFWSHTSHANRESRFREERFIRHVERQFDLSQEQRRQIHAIVRRHHEALKQIRGETEPRIREVFESMRYEIESVLSLSDFQEWDRQFERMERRWLGPQPPPHERRHNRGDRFRSRGPDSRDRFDEIDRDRNGRISMDEFLNAHEGPPDFPPPPEPDEPADTDAR
ncbi:MAG: hypothetical protein IID08_04420 [Candidatus Hydrogenedentes bacterium]|nr:hypothetical protein [Candidatus Hydrogenedentota bacterium]